MIKDRRAFFVESFFFWDFLFSFYLYITLFKEEVHIFTRSKFQHVIVETARNL
jgi:hypothetical protein